MVADGRALLGYRARICLSKAGAYRTSSEVRRSQKLSKLEASASITYTVSQVRGDLFADPWALLNRNRTRLSFIKADRPRGALASRDRSQPQRLLASLS